MTREEAKREILFAKREVMADSWIDKAYDVAIKALEQPEIVHCRDCVYGEQDVDGRWFCNSFYCQVGDADGSGFCADAERRKDG